MSRSQYWIIDLSLFRLSVWIAWFDTAILLLVYANYLSVYVNWNKTKKKHLNTSSIILLTAPYSQSAKDLNTSSIILLTAPYSRSANGANIKLWRYIQWELDCLYQLMFLTSNLIYTGYWNIQPMDTTDWKFKVLMIYFGNGQKAPVGS